MAITFPRVPPVAPGDPITSTQLAKLADGINDRLRSGLADGPRRLIWYWLSQFRQIRNSDASGFLFPSQAEFFEIYQHVHPSEYEWPFAGPGEPEGINLSSLMGAFVFGDPDNDQEDIRLLDTSGLSLTIDGVQPTTNAQKWALAKLQRGAWAPDTGLMASPSFTAARAVFGIIRSTFGPHGMAYGGFFPTPELATPDNCSDSTPDIPATPSYIIKFTSLVAGVADKTYPGTCAGVAGNVVAIGYTPDQYVVISNDGGGNPTVVEYLPLNEWLEGPYSGVGVLRRRPSGFLQRAMNYFAAQFRGSDAQRLAGGAWNGNAFDFQKFIESQYALAPARGADIGGGQVVPLYPEIQWYGAATFTAGTRGYLRDSPGNQSYTVAEGHVLVSCLFAAQKLVGSVRVQVWSQGVLIHTETLTADEDGNADALHVFALPPNAGAVIYTRLDSTLTLSEISSTAGVIVEFAEVMAYKPLAHDWYMVLRCGGARVELANGTDGIGFDEIAAREIGESLTVDGVLVNVHGDPGLAGAEPINNNAVFESARRLSKSIRILRRNHLVGYEVTGGKSILYFRRQAFGDGGGAAYDAGAPPAAYEVASGSLIPGQSYLVTGTTPGADYVTHDGLDYDPTEIFKATSTTYTAFGDAKVYVLIRTVIPSGTTGALDAFDGIAPSRYPIGPADVEVGRAYVVRGTSGTATYVGTNYAPGQEFTGISGSNVVTTTGDATVFAKDGIRSVATPASFTNEWLLGFDFKVYRNQDTSPWKPEAFSDWAPFSDRCQFYQDWNALALNADAKRHFAYGSKVWAFPEAVPGYRYAFDLNRKTCDPLDTACIAARLRFYKSCRLYEPFVEMESTEVLIEGTDEIVKVTLKGRLHHHEDAPASIARDITTWNRTILHAEDYRTDENAIREYLVNQVYGENCTGGEDHAGVQTGNSGLRSAVWDQPSPPFGACYPSIYMVKLIEKPYEDSNDTQDPTDTPFLHDQLLRSELTIRAMCEGYIDGATSELYGCSTGLYSLYDFTFENLCLDAFNGRWFGSMASVETEGIPAESTRSDKPQGFGPLPNTLASSESYNQFAAAVNKLTKVRIDIPFVFEVKQWIGTAQQSVGNVDYSNGGTSDCPGATGPAGSVWGGTPPDAPADTLDFDWTPTLTAGSSTFSEFLTTGGSPNLFSCDGTNWIVITHRLDQDYRIAPNDPDIVNAFQPAWADMVATNGGVLAQINETINPVTFTTGDVTEGTTCGGSANPYYPTLVGGEYLVFSAEPTLNTVNRCAVVTAGRLHAQPPPDSKVRGCFRSETDSQAFTAGPGTAISLAPVVGSTPFFEVPLA